jgi:hypothetical protein
MNEHEGAVRRLIEQAGVRGLPFSDEPWDWRTEYADLEDGLREYDGYARVESEPPIVCVGNEVIGLFDRDSA